MPAVSEVTIIPTVSMNRQACIPAVRLDVRSVERVEINEAFVAIAIVAARVDVGGSVIACGDAIGAIGSELTTKLIRSTDWDGLNLGIVTLCIGGPGNKLAIEMLH